MSLGSLMILILTLTLFALGGFIHPLRIVAVGPSQNRREVLG